MTTDSWFYQLVFLRFDAVSLSMAALVSFVGGAVFRFAYRYLEGEPRRQAFLGGLAATWCSVLLLILAGNLWVLWGAWVATSLTLHRLLLFYPERPGAIFAARKKAVISRIGDAALLAAILVLVRHYQTADLQALFVAARGGDVAPLPLVGGLAVLCAACKSAQFPLHSWLPETMETPTPVSAFMHAGIINAGGYLLIRLAPLMVQAELALQAATVLGALTAAFGAVVMLTQPSVKRALAFSTVAQMGFLLLQCGLGAFGLALLHIAAHSIYKANAFLTSGSTIGTVPRAAVPLKTRAIVGALPTAAFLVTGLATLVSALGQRLNGSEVFFVGLLGLSVTYGWARAWSVQGGRWFMLQTFAAGALVVSLSFTLHVGAHALFPLSARHAPAAWVGITLGLIFLGLFLFQLVLWRAGHHAIGRRLYVHALNGFYVSTYANRLLGRLWPRSLHA